MRKHYDFSKGVPNPYVNRVKRSVTIRLDESSLVYFKGISEQLGIPYQTLINLYLRDCAMRKKKLAMIWKPGG
jgi:predicted DNA binding CopG/RHH family protein